MNIPFPTSSPYHFQHFISRFRHRSERIGQIFRWCLFILVAITVPATGEPDLESAPIQALATEFRKTVAESNRAFWIQRRELAQAQLEEAYQMLARARTAGNISAQASARNLAEILEAALASLGAEDSPEFPERIRREIEQTLNEYRRRDQEVVDAREAQQQRIENEFLERFATVLMDAGTAVDADQQRRHWARVLHEPLAKEPAAVEPDAASDTHDEPTPDPAEPSAPVLPDVIGASGTAAEWMTIGMIEVEVNAMEVIRIPLHDQENIVTLRGTGPISGQPYSLRYTPSRKLQSHKPAPVFQAIPLGGMTPLDIIAWPSPRNQWNLDIRVRPRGSVPAQHGARLQADAEIAATWPQTRQAVPEPEAEDPEASNGEKSLPPTPAVPVRVRIVSDPPGALVLIGGQMLVRGQRGVTTPADIRIPVDTRSIRLRLPGYMEYVLETPELRDGQTFHAKLENDPDVVDQTFTVSANTPDWTMSPVRVREGQTVRILAQGQWSCGSRGERTGPVGYPNDDRFFHYYAGPHAGPRQTTESNYGALLVRIGRGGTLRAVGERLSFVAETSGFLYFDINERADPVLRRDNQGQLNVRVQALTNMP